MRKDGLQRRDEILDAALQCFVSTGVLQTGIEEIRKAAGASPSSIYHHFGGLPGVTLALLIRTFERLFTHLATEVTREKSAERAVKALVRAHLDWVFANRDEARFMYQAMTLELAAHDAGSLQQAKAEQLQPLVTHLSTFIAKGTLPRWSPLVFDVVLLGTAHEACRRYLGGADLQQKWMRTTLPELAWQGVAAERTRRRRHAP